MIKIIIGPLNVPALEQTIYKVISRCRQSHTFPFFSLLLCSREVNVPVFVKMWTMEERTHGILYRIDWKSALMFAKL